MAHSVVSMFKDGQDYLNTWPVKKELYPYFPECRVIAATKLALTVMPPLAILVCAVMVNIQGLAYLPQALAIGAFFLSLPLQGLLWLGHRSNQVLPPQLKHWYQDIHRKMQAEGCEISSMKTRPQFKELASLLKVAFDELDRIFTQKWFQ
ncbi:DUF412 domain-containing protein [Alteromonas aestuariivivens]|uniref:UPF0208 membrane protein YfbV n=1 Tax=Alteromonas aestuariivivens TaxID=1938339 RepID=A0A3D8M8V2_9ALTE|nr:terminus macrodomain insulation protein YfbV [Alteromonas aestuariivivens]RDV26162.1 DUF412 domain-containing protein [Alteromonas aestuariivivens]